MSGGGHNRETERNALVMADFAAQMGYEAIDRKYQLEPGSARQIVSSQLQAQRNLSDHPKQSAVEICRHCGCPMPCPPY